MSDEIHSLKLQRFIEIDVMRGFAIIAVVAIHVTSTVLQYRGSEAWLAGSMIVINQYARYATPLFLLLSGLTLTLSQIRKPLSPIGFYKKRLFALMWPYSMWSLFLTFLGLGGFTDQLPKMFLENVLLGKADYPFYFMVLIFQCYGLFPFLHYFLSKRTPKQVIKIVAFVSIIQVLLLFLFMRNSLVGIPQNSFVAFRLITYWMAYFVIGVAIGIYRETIIETLQTYKGRVVAIAVGIIGGYLILEVYLWKIVYWDVVHFFRPSTVVYACIASLALYKLAHGWKHSINKTSIYIRQIVELYGKHSFGIFLVHTFLLHKFILPFVQPLPGVLFALTLFAGTLISSLLFIHLMNFLRLQLHTIGSENHA